MNIETPSNPDFSQPPPPPVYIPQCRRKKRWVLWSVLVISLLVNFSTCARMGEEVLNYGSEEYPKVDQTLAWGEAQAPVKVAVIALEGVILRESSGTLFGEGVDPVTKILYEIRAATVDPDYRAILLVVNSPGGGVTSSDEIFQALMDFKASNPDRKVVVHVRDMAASGGYYVAMAGDLLVAQPTSVVGSVGVIISAVNMNQLGEKMGIEDVSLTSSSNKALLNPLSPVNPEHREILQQVIDQMYDHFRSLVLANRPFDAAYADKNNLLDGRIFSQPDALSFGLVDETGYLDHTRKRVLDLLGIDVAGFYRVEYTVRGWESFFSVKSPKVFAPLKLHSGFQYMWNP